MIQSTTEQAETVSGQESAGDAGAARYANDRALLARLAPDVRAKFVAYMIELDAADAQRGRPYGEGSLWETTGAECWFTFFEDGYSPKDALAEDESCWDGE